MIQRYHTMDDLKSLPVGTLPRFCKKRELKVKIEKCKYLTLESVEKARVNQTCHRRGSGGKAPSRWAIFCNFFWKKHQTTFFCNFNDNESHFARVSEPFENIKFLKFESQLKRRNCLMILLQSI